MAYKLKQPKKYEKDYSNDSYYFSKSGSLWKLHNRKINDETKEMIEKFDLAFSKSQRQGTYREFKNEIQKAFLQDDEREAQRILQMATEVENKYYV